jgi:hypothetical protein
MSTPQNPVPTRASLRWALDNHKEGRALRTETTINQPRVSWNRSGRVRSALMVGIFGYWAAGWWVFFSPLSQLRDVP